jgi:exopolysaccharide production protein ExoZ
VFFVISGFIMMLVSQGRTVADFVRRRIVRIVPLYWIFTILFVAIHAQFVPHAIEGWDWTHLIQSLLFIPYESPIFPGELWPLLVPGWTLNLEMFFYAIVAIGILTRNVFATLCAVILPLVILGVLFPDIRNPIFEAYTTPLLLEFLVGAVIGYAVIRGVDLARIWPLLPIGAVIAALLTLPQVPEDLLNAVRFIPAIAIVAGAVALDSRTPKFRSAFLRTLGDASYAIYLSHILTLQAVLALWKRLPISGWLQFFTLLVASMVLCVAVGLLVHFAEQWVKGRLGRPPPSLATT